MLKGQIFFATDEFINQLSNLLDEKGQVKEVPRLQRKVEGKPKDMTIYGAYVRYGYTMKEIAEHLGFRYATISRAIRRVEHG